MSLRMMALLLALLPAPYGAASAAAPPVALTPEQALAIGQQIWRNEGQGKVDNLTVWNAGEDFPSFGIGHFIWYPAGVTGPFTESFPQLLEFLRADTALPAWLADVRHAPWPNREAFYARINSAELRSMRDLLQHSIAQQTAFIVRRMEASLPQMLATLPTAAERERVQQRFHAVAQQANGIYALIDYVNFKGEGIAPLERYQGEGWGLLQVLQTMRGDAEVMADFVAAADHVLTRRVQNAPRDESRWLPGWRKRLQTYR